MQLHTVISPWSFLLLPIIYYLVPYFRNRALRGIPGPRLAALSNLWLLYQCRRGRRYQAVDEAHKKYGPLVRLQPNHVSIADADAIGIIYSHTGGWLKSEYYDAFVSIRRGLFNTRDRAEHTRKRKTISHTFSARSIAQFEPYIRFNLGQLVKQWDAMFQAAVDGGKEYVEMDCLHWLNYLAFDIIGDLAFGTPFGMLPAGADRAEVQTLDGVKTYAPAIQVLNRRGEVSATLGCLPALKPYAPYLPDAFFRNGLRAVSSLTGIAVARVNARLEEQEESKGRDIDSGRKDLLARLMEGRDENGEKLGREELTSEALTQLIAGSDTTSNATCAWLFWCLNTEGVYEKLQEELDQHIPPNTDVVEYDMVKDLPYLNYAVQETLRIHSTSSLGLPRLVPPTGSGVTINSHYFPPNTALSVPAYTIHHSPAIWNPGDKPDPAFDPSRFNPERWSPSRLTEAQKAAFIPFSTGPRACVGRNVAEMELKMICATVTVGYDFVLDEGQKKEGLKTREGFLRKPVACKVRMKKRERQS